MYVQLVYTDVFVRTLPRAMVIGLTIVSLCYFFVNLSFFSILSNDEIVGTQAVALVSQHNNVIMTHMPSIISLLFVQFLYILYLLYQWLPFAYDSHLEKL